MSLLRDFVPRNDKNISPPTYKEQKRGENAKDWEKNLKIF